jgi:hypothetical protein
MTGSVDVTLRPIRLAFLIDPSDAHALLEAIEISTFLWGGEYCPIIPVFKRTPRTWSLWGSRKPDCRQVVAGYLDAFDPDFILPLGACANQKIEVGGRKVISTAEVTSSIASDGMPQYGVGLFEILSHLIEKEFKYLRREPVEAFVPTIGSRYRPFLASIFGLLSDKVRKTFFEQFAGAIGAKAVPCSVRSYAELLALDSLFPRTISSLYLKTYRKRSLNDGRCMFYMDAGNLLDIIDYWNLRAIGWTVLPIAGQSCHLDAMLKAARAFVEDSFYPDDLNPRIHHCAILMKSRNSSEQDLEGFVSSLDLPPAAKRSQVRITTQHWYPRIWDEWARDKDGCECAEVEARSESVEVSESKTRISIRALVPAMIRCANPSPTPRFANELNPRFYGDTEPVAEVVPVGDESLVFAAGAFGPSGSRVGRRGLVFFPRHARETIHYSAPHARGVMASWLRSLGWKVEPVPPGLVASQMLRQLGGRQGIDLIAKKEVVELLWEMREGKAMAAQEFGRRIAAIAGDSLVPDADIVLGRFLDHRVFRLGIEVKCTVCGQGSWYSLTDMDYMLQCPRCGGEFGAPQGYPREFAWSYGTFGPFNLPKRALGAYTVLLTLRFFSDLAGGATTPMMGFTLEKARAKHEVDLCLLYQESRFRTSGTQLIFAEGKTHNNFERNDKSRMAALGDSFPGSTLVFATLKGVFGDLCGRFRDPECPSGSPNGVRFVRANPKLGVL